MANIRHLIRTFEPAQKTYVLSFCCVGGERVGRNANFVLGDIGWIRVTDFIRVYRKVISDDNFTQELQQLKETLAGFRSNADGARVEFTLNVAINFNDIGDPVDGVEYMFNNN